MAESESGDNIAALLTLECPNHHYCGQLITHVEGHGAIDYRNLDGVGFPGSSTFKMACSACRRARAVANMNLRRYPRGCRRSWTSLPTNPDKDQGSYTLPFLGPPRELGQITETDS